MQLSGGRKDGEKTRLKEQNKNQKVVSRFKTQSTESFTTQTVLGPPAEFSSVSPAV